MSGLICGATRLDGGECQNKISHPSQGGRCGAKHRSPNPPGTDGPNAESTQSLKNVADQTFEEPSVGAALGWNETDVDMFYRSYVEAALWSSPEIEEAERKNKHKEGFSLEHLAPETAEMMRTECEDFIRSTGTKMSDWSPEQAGHDFWLTRNGHGVGFWDRGKGAVGDELSEDCKVYGEQNLWVENGKIYAE